MCRLATIRSERVWCMHSKSIGKRQSWSLRVIRAGPSVTKDEKRVGYVTLRRYFLHQPRAFSSSYV